MFFLTQIKHYRIINLDYDWQFIVSLLNKHKVTQGKVYMDSQMDGWMDRRTNIKTVTGNHTIEWIQYDSNSKTEKAEKLHQTSDDFQQ